jgi:parallel beta-helix repeat protein
MSVCDPVRKPEPPSRRPLKHRRLGWLCVTVATLAACSSPTASTAPTTPSAYVSITGTSVLTAVGQTSQLTAKSSSGIDVTRVVTWQTSNTAVATVTTSGLVTATGLGTASIQAIYQSTTSMFSVFVGGQGTFMVTACGFLSIPGTYLVPSDLPPAPGIAPCLTINVSSVQLNCQGHNISNLLLSNVSNVTVSNCIISTASGSNVSTLTLSGSTLEVVNLVGSSSIVVQNNTINDPSGGAVSLQGGGNNQVVHNIISGSNGYGVLLQGGSNNQVVQNTINGLYNGGPTQNGLDDCVALQNEVGDLIQGNTFMNSFDTGVESVDSLANTTIADNTMTNIGNAGIGAYYCTNWANNVVRNNSVSGSPGLLLVTSSQGPKCGSQITAAGFTGNQMIGNTFRNPAAGYQSSIVVAVPRMYVYFAPGTPVMSNLLQGNDFGSEEGPELTPLAGFIDGGGNICAALSSGSAANFACSSGGPSRRRYQVARR